MSMNIISLQNILSIQKLLHKVPKDSGIKLLKNLVSKISIEPQHAWAQKYNLDDALWDKQTLFFEEAKETLENTEISTSDLLDLSGVECPRNLAKAVLFLKDKPVNNEYTLILDSGSPIENVPRGLKQRAYQVGKRVKLNDGKWKVFVFKV